jgi:GTP cyclohydrolase III
MNRSKANLISQKIKEALYEVSKSVGVDLQLGNLSFTSTSITARIDGKEVGNPQVDKQNLLLSKRYGFPQNIVGMDFIHPKWGKFTILDIKTANRTYPILATRESDGKVYKFSKESILNYLGGNNIINRKANLKKLLSDGGK